MQLSDLKQTWWKVVLHILDSAPYTPLLGLWCTTDQVQVMLMSPEQAREMAEELVKFADRAERVDPEAVMVAVTAGPIQ